MAQPTPERARVRVLPLAAAVAAWAMALVATAAADPLQVQGLTFPDQVAGAQRGKQQDFEKTTPGLGYAVEYRRPEWRIDVYVYDMGVKSIPSDPQSEPVKQEFEQAKNDVFRLQKRGTYADVTVKREYTIDDAGGRPQFACATFGYVQTRENKAVDSVLCLTGRNNKFVKFRVTLPARPDAEAEARQFIEAWRGLL